MKLHQLGRRLNPFTDFLAVATHGSIRQAASKLHISQSALTRRIQDLEYDLGVALFERTAHGMVLSKFGEVLKRHAQTIHASSSDAVRELKELMEGSTGELNIAAGPAWVYALVPDAVAKVQRDYPLLTINLFSWMNDVALPLLSAGQLDIVVGGLPEPSQREPGIAYIPVIEIESLVFAKDSHPLNGRSNISTADLTLYPWIFFAEAPAARFSLEMHLKKDRLRIPSASVETTSVHAGLRLMQSGDYLMLLPSTLSSIAGYHQVAALSMGTLIDKYVAGMMCRESLLGIHACLAFRDALLMLCRELSERV